MNYGRRKSLVDKEKKSDIYENRYHFLIDNILDVVGELDSNGIFTYVNPYIYKELGYRPEELIGQKLYEFVHPDDVKKLTKVLFSSVKFDKPVPTFRIINKESRFIWFEIKAKSLKDYNGQRKILITLKNVTQFKELEGQLRENEEKYRILFENAPFAIVIFRQDGTILDFNKSSKKLFGYNKNELVGKHFTQLATYKKEYKELIEERYKLLLKEKKLEPIEIQCIKKNGSNFWALSNINAIEIGNEIFLLGIIQDITEIKRIEQRLQESEEKFRTIAEKSSLGIVILQDNMVKYVNKRYADLVDYKVEDIISWKPGEFIKTIHPEDKNMIMHHAELRQKGLNDEVNHYIYRGLKESGEMAWFEVFANTIMYKGRPADLGISLDITEQIKAEQKIKASEEKYRDLIETSSMGLFEIDLVKGGVAYINPRLLKIIGYTKEEMNDENILYKVIYPKDIDKIKKDHEERNVEFKLLDKNGKTKWLSGTVLHYYDDQGDLVKSRLWLQDITERKELDELKSNLLTRFSHEFKTPLISIKGFTDLLLTEHSENLGENSISFLRKIKEGAERLKILINDFIESTQLEKNLVELVKTRENLSDLIKDGIAEMEGMIKIRGHKIHLDIHNELIINIDKNRIYNVFTNLLLNAIKFTPKKGEITIQTKIEKNSVIVSIKDTGIGLQKKEIKQLFQPFGKIERYGEGWDIISDGMGLGLFLSKEIIDLHGGRIWAKSDGRNKGCIFFFSLPVIN